MGDMPFVINFEQLSGRFGDTSEAAYAQMVGDAPLEGADEIERAMMEATIRSALAALQAEQIRPDVMSSPTNRAAAVLQTVLAEHADELGELRDLPAGGQEVRFDHHDPGWLRQAFKFLKDKLNIGEFDFLPVPRQLDEIPSSARIAILGDFGTGLYGAPFCKSSIERAAKEDSTGFDVVLHLGDVYYSGSKEEIRKNFLDMWPDIPGSVSRACNSNHEMYSGGKPYAELTLPAFRQSSSLFGFENEHWVLVGLDTAYTEFDIGPLQVGWLHGLASQLRGRKMIFFSHHQLFSKFKSQGKNLQHKLRELLAGQNVFAWYWGHEHLCAIYDHLESWNLYGRCIGHSAYPYSHPVGDASPVTTVPGGAWYNVPADAEAPAAKVLDGPNPHIEGHESDFGPNGYAVLELDREHLTEKVFSADGELQYEARLA